MLRRSIVVLSLVLSGFASRAHAGWSDWTWNWPAIPPFALETATAPAGPSPSQRCVAYGELRLLVGFYADVFCDDDGGGLVQFNSIPTVGDPSVAMDQPADVSGGFTAPYFAYSDPGAAQIWYGVAGQTPVLALEGVVAHSLSLAHFSDGTPFLVYRGAGDRIYTASRKPTGEWSQMQLTNNTSSTGTWSVDAVVVQDMVHIAYWDETWKAIRYARREGAAWTFETAKDLAGTQFVTPAVAAGDLGRAYIAYNGRDGLLHYLRRTAANTWTETTFAPPSPVSYDGDRGPVGFAVDLQRRAHFVYGTGNANDLKTLRYVNKPILGGFQDSLQLAECGSSPEGFRGVDMVRSGERPDVSMITSASCDLTGIVGLGCGNCQ